MNMMITKHTVVNQLLAYMSHQLTLAQLVDWAEIAIMTGELELENESVIMNTLAKLGLADVNNFGLLWEDCEQLMFQLGYKMKVEAALVV